MHQTSADYQRFQYLLKEGAASPREFEGVEARYQSARAALSAAQAQAREASTMQGYTVIRAPRAAVVASREVAVGDLAQPGQPLLSLYNPAELKVEGEVNDSYRDRVHTGELVQVSVPAVNWQGEVAIAEIFPISQSPSRTFKVRTATVRDPKLMPGMFARLSLPLGSAMGILIPQARGAAGGPARHGQGAGRRPNPVAPGEAGAAARGAGGSPGGPTTGRADYIAE